MLKQKSKLYNAFKRKITCLCFTHATNTTTNCLKTFCCCFCAEHFKNNFKSIKKPYILLFWYLKHAARKQQQQQQQQMHQRQSNKNSAENDCRLLKRSEEEINAAIDFGREGRSTTKPRTTSNNKGATHFSLIDAAIDKCKTHTHSLTLTHLSSRGTHKLLLPNSAWCIVLQCAIHNRIWELTKEWNAPCTTGKHFATKQVTHNSPSLQSNMRTNRQAITRINAWMNNPIE